MDKGEVINKFHDHLNKCVQCENHPFDLCPIGQKLLLSIQENEAEDEQNK
jgi:hypothetical protein